MADHVIGVGERPAERQHDAPAQRLGDAAGALAELALDRVRLLESACDGVEDQRLAAAQLVTEAVRERRAYQRSAMRAAISTPRRSSG